MPSHLATRARSRMFRLAMAPGLLLAGLFCSEMVSSYAQQPKSPQANKRFSLYREKVQPLLEKNCYRCHGPKKQRGGLRLSSLEHMLTGGDSGPALVIGDSTKSLLIHSVNGSHGMTRMPLRRKPLLPEEIQILKRWIDQGAKAPRQRAARARSDHWSFQPIQAPEVPRVRSGSAANPVDAFILARLEKEGIKPSKEADRRTLIRRLSLDLRGLPPTPEEVEAAVHDPRPEWYEKRVDAFLASPHYGEHWGRYWLDVARYADTDGYQTDLKRDIWKYRDYVIQSFNGDHPWDRFIIEQLAGDLLTNPTPVQKTATGFLRNAPYNREAGVDPEQSRFERIVNYTNTIGTAFLGLTLECARCHTHKYDPVSLREYYQLFAIFNSVSETQLQLPTPEEQDALLQADRKIYVLRERLKELEKAPAPAAPPPAQWQLLGSPGRDSIQAPALWIVGGAILTLLLFLTAIATKRRALTRVLLVLPGMACIAIGIGSDGLHAIAPDVMAELPSPTPGPSFPEWHLLKSPRASSLNGATFALRPDGAWDVGGTVATPELFTIEGEVHMPVVTGIRLELIPSPKAPQQGVGLARDGNFALTELKVQIAPLGSPHLLEPVAIAKADAFGCPADTWIHHALDDDDFTHWKGGSTFLPQHQERAKLPRTAVFQFERPFYASEGAGIVLRLHQKCPDHVFARFRASVTGSLQRLRAIPEKIQGLLRAPAYQLTPEEQAELHTFRNDRVQQDIQNIAYQIPPITSTLTMAKSASVRPTFIHIRGEHNNKGPRVFPAAPAVLPPLPGGKEATRLHLAQWLTSNENPLTARVLVNRIWQRCFGQGLVSTENDFGKQGSAPSHPRLLEWLACYFRDRGWSQKKVLRLIVTSAAYRQSSRSRPEIKDRDPRNQLLARQNRFRVDAEVVRDIALSVSGQLCRIIGGPGVYPYQPKAIIEQSWQPWKWPTSRGEDRFRRGLYTFLRRTSPHPLFQMFDGPGTLKSCTRRDRSTTATQALMLLNDPTYTELARKLAEKLIAQPVGGDAQRIDSLYRECLSRPPQPWEAQRLQQFLDLQRQEFARDETSARALIATSATSLPPHEMAAWIAVCRVLLNLDELITRE